MLIRAAALREKLFWWVWNVVPLDGRLQQRGSFMSEFMSEIEELGDNLPFSPEGPEREEVSEKQQVASIHLCSSGNDTQGTDAA